MVLVGVVGDEVVATSSTVVVDGRAVVGADVVVVGGSPEALHPPSINARATPAAARSRIRWFRRLTVRMG